MNSRRFVNLLLSILLMNLFFRFIGLLIRFWYISIPVILAAYFYLRKRISILNHHMFGKNSDSQSEPGNDEDIIDADFTVVDEEDDE